MNIPFISADAMKDYAVRTKVFILSVFLLVALVIVAAVGIYANYQAKRRDVPSQPHDHSVPERCKQSPA